MEYQRQDGLYVSLSVDEDNCLSVRYPRSVTREEAEFVISLLAITKDSSLELAFAPLAAHYANEDDEGRELLDTAIPALKRLVSDAAAFLKSQSST